MKLTLDQTNILINCAKTTVRIITDSPGLASKIDFTVENLNASCEAALNQSLQFRDLAILRAACIFCMSMGGLENFGLNYNQDEIQTVLLDIGE